MKSSALIRIAVAISLLASLVLGQPAFAARPAAHAVGGEHMAMSGDMDCCPKKQAIPRGPADPKCVKCLLMALCSTPMASEEFGLRLPSLFATSYRHAAPADEAYLLGRESPPLPETPRSLI